MHFDCMVKCVEVHKKCTKCQKDLKFDDILKIEFDFEVKEIQSFKKDVNTGIQMVNRFNANRQDELGEQLQYEKDNLYKALEQLNEQQKQKTRDLSNLVINPLKINSLESFVDKHNQNLAINHMQIEEGILNLQDLRMQFTEQQSLQEVELASFKNKNKELTSEVQEQKIQNESLTFAKAELEKILENLYLETNESGNLLKNQDEEINNLKQKNIELNNANEVYKEEVELMQGYNNSLVKGANDYDKDKKRQTDYNSRLENLIESLKTNKSKYASELEKTQETSQELKNQKGHNNRLQQQVQKLTTIFQKVFLDMRTGCNKLVNDVIYLQTKRISEEEIEVIIVDEHMN